MVLLPVALLLFPLEWLKDGPTLCLSQLIFGQECPGCGMTRACMHTIHFNFAEAFRFNRLVVVVFPLLVGLYTKDFFNTLENMGALSLQKTWQAFRHSEHPILRRSDRCRL